MKYIVLIRFTEKGAGALQQSTDRAQSFAKAAASHNVKIEAQYWTVGSRDGVILLEGPDETSILRSIAELNAAGFVRTETLRALTAGEFDQVVKP